MNQTEQSTTIDIQKLSTEQLIYWCPKEVLDMMACEANGKEYKYKKPEDWPGHSSYFICTKKGECGLISGISMSAWLLRNVYEGNLDSVNHRPPINPTIARILTDFVKIL